MTKAKHTPGPWEVINGTDVFTKRGALNASGMMARENDGWHIADCDTSYTRVYGENEFAKIPADEQRANAHLIAAAPELLDALKAAHKWLLICDDPRSGDDLKKVDAALRHAEGII